MKQVGQYKDVKDVYASFINEDCKGKCRNCFFGINTVWINEKTSVTLCHLLAKVVKYAQETKED